MRQAPSVTVVIIALTLAFAVGAPPSSGQCPLGSRAGPGSDLALRAGPGASHVARVTTDQTSSQTVMGQEQTTRQLLTTTLRFQVLPGGDGERLVQVTYQGVRIETEGPTQGMTWDSSDSSRAAPPELAMYAALVGRPYTVAVSEDGTTRRLAEWDAVAEALLRSMPPAPGMNREEAKVRLAREMGDAVLTEAVRGAIMSLPGGRRDTGSTWSCTLSSSAPIPLTQESDLTLRQRRGGALALDFDARMASDSTVVITTGPAPMSFALRGTSHGTLEVEERTGWILRSRVETEMSGALRFRAGQGAPMAVPMRSRAVVTVEPFGGG